jgi:putative endonuclease
LANFNIDPDLLLDPIFFMRYFIYILYSDSKDKYYIGSTAELEKRLLRHNQGATKSTKGARPWRIVYSETYEDKTEALKRELYIKRMKSRIYIESLILQNKN